MMFVYVMVFICALTAIEDVYRMGQGGRKIPKSVDDHSFNAVIMGILVIWGIVVILRGS